MNLLMKNKKGVSGAWETLIDFGSVEVRFNYIIIIDQNQIQYKLLRYESEPKCFVLLRKFWFILPNSPGMIQHTPSLHLVLRNSVGGCVDGQRWAWNKTQTYECWLRSICHYFSRAYAKVSACSIVVLWHEAAAALEIIFPLLIWHFLFRIQTRILFGSALILHQQPSLWEQASYCFTPLFHPKVGTSGRLACNLYDWQTGSQMQHKTKHTQKNIKHQIRLR